MLHLPDVKLDELDPYLLSQLEDLENLVGRELLINSGYREADARTHGLRLAVDIACAESTLRYRLVKEAYNLKFKRIGVYTGHVHLDLGPSALYPQDVLWLGVSR